MTIINKHNRFLRAFLVVLLLAAAVLVAAALLTPPAPEFAFFDSDRPMVIAHQGGEGLRPSNTMLAFENAMALGVDVLEMDCLLYTSRCV